MARKRIRNAPYRLPMMMASLSLASWETILRRTQMMAQGTCSAAEYWRMAAEKSAAAQASMAALLRGKNSAAVMTPFVTRARANARRLRRKK
jgi:hypothetical protein